MKNYNFDLISDIHLDFHINVRHPEHKMNMHISKFVNSILPEQPQSILVIAGDLGHYNHQNKQLLIELKKIYQHIILVSGNHDYYLVSSNVQKRYKNSSMKRIMEMRKMSSEIENVHYLDGNIVEIDGIKFGGAGMWYDFSYGMITQGISKESLYSQWREIMNDSHLIKGLDFRNDFNEAVMENSKLDNIINDCDVIVTHVGGDWSRVNSIYKFDASTSFYYFDGSKYFDDIGGKVWVFGHVHDRIDYDAWGCRFINASYGYPEEARNRKIVNIINSNPWIQKNNY